MKFDILNRFNGEVQFTAEIDCSDDTDIGVRLGLAVKWAVNNGVNLVGASLYGANLEGASLEGANLVDANLVDANLCGANLEGANLVDANLVDANLCGANLRGASLVDANLCGANLRGANLVDANLCGTNLRGANRESVNLIIGGQRSDGYRFMLMRDSQGNICVRAGCRFFSIMEARAHWQKTRAGTMLGEESLALVDDLERRATILSWFKLPADGLRTSDSTVNKEEPEWQRMRRRRHDSTSWSILRLCQRR